MTRRRVLGAGLVMAVAAVVAVSVVLLVRPGGTPTSPTGSPPGGATLAAADAPGATTLVGTGHPGYGGDGGAGPQATLDSPSGIAVDGAGDLFVADTGNCRVRELPARSGVAFGMRVRAGVVVTVVGGACGSAHPAPAAVATDGSGDLFVAYPTTAMVDELRADPSVSGAGSAPERPTVVAGTGATGSGGDGGPARSAELDHPSGVAVDRIGDVFVADTGNCRLRMVASGDATRFGVAVHSGDIYTVAGTGVCGAAGDGGPALAAQLWDPGALAVDSAGDVLVADQGNRTIRELAAVSGTSFGVTLGAGELGTVAGEGSYGPYLVDGLPAVGQTAELNFPSGLALDPGGNLYVADGPMHVIRFVADGPATLAGHRVAAGTMVTAAGALASGTLDNRITWVRTQLSDPMGLAWTPSGRLVYSDAGVHVVRELPAGG